jgi:hypothetical protein
LEAGLCKIVLNLKGRGRIDESPDSRGQEAGTQETGCTRGFWDALTELPRAIILRAMGKPPWLFYFFGGKG